jgi:hypothetical protein
VKLGQPQTLIAVAALVLQAILEKNKNDDGQHKNV